MDTYKINRPDLVQDLINTYDLFMEDPEHLHTPHDLLHFLQQRGLPTTSVTQTDLDETCALRSQMRLAWTAETPADMINLLNPLIDQTPMTLHFEETEGAHVHLRVEGQTGTSLTQRLALECALGMVDVLEQHGHERMRACSAEPCRDVFIDTSRNNSRRFCSDRCANRYNISAFRERQKGKS